MRKLLILLALMTAVACAQTNPAKPKQAAVPVDVVPVDKEPAHKLVFENEYVRVFSVEVAPHSETKYHQHDRDYVGVILGDAEVESVRVGEAAVRVQLKDGETRFTKGGFAHKAVNKSDKPFRNVTVELKKGSEGKVEVCAAPQECTRVGRSGEHVINITTTLFTSRTLRAFRHTLEARGSLSSSYYSPNSDDRVLIVALTPIGLLVDGIPKQVDAGETWFGAVHELEVSAGDKDVGWVVFRITLPRPPPRRAATSRLNREIPRPRNKRAG